MQHLISSHSFRVARGLLASLLILVVLLLGQLSVLPDWHSSFHALLNDPMVERDCESSGEETSDSSCEHSCVIDAFAQGGVLVELDTTSYAGLTQYLIRILPASTEEFARAISERGPPGRAPPFFIV